MTHDLSIRIKWVALRTARRFVRDHHRHAPKLTGGIVALGAWRGDQLAGVVVLGRPTARQEKPDTVEITRLCTIGERNLCSRLYAKAKRLAHALGFVGIKTFTLIEEPGASLRAIGATHTGHTKREGWTRNGRPRADENTGRKQRWAI